MSRSNPLSIPLQLRNSSRNGQLKFELKSEVSFHRRNVQGFSPSGKAASDSLPPCSGHRQIRQVTKITKVDPPEHEEDWFRLGRRRGA
jgi:hypothetical protein